VKEEEDEEGSEEEGSEEEGSEGEAIGARMRYKSTGVVNLF